MLILLFSFFTFAPAPPSTDYEANLTALLEQVVTDEGLVQYDLLRGRLRKDFQIVHQAIQSFDASTLQSDAEKLAFWMNAYNVLMLNNIIEAPDVENVLADNNADRFFKTPLQAANLKLSLDDIEHGILRKQFGSEIITPLQLEHIDPRIHVGLNCAAVSCPRLRQQAFRAATLETDLDAAMREYVNSTAHFRKEGDALVLSSLLDWFGADFDTLEPAGSYLMRYLDSNRPNAEAFQQLFSERSIDQIKAVPNVQFAYDWTVNKAK